MKKVLIANRGEIAVRIIRACHELDLSTVAIYSEADKKSLHVLMADEAICVGPPPSLHSYLNIPRILSACEITGADAIHPGYGFLSENAHFASICESSGITFIGPTSQSIAYLGDKAKAKELAKKTGCPIIPGSPGIVSSFEEAQTIAQKIGYPLVVKAVAGGGGRGIRVVTDKKEFERMFSAAKAEAELSFNNSDVYIEKLIIDPRHIEIQIVADKHGHIVHLGERDCTLQRRRQKLIEEAPSPILTQKLRDKITHGALKLIKAAKYHSLATVEFLLDDKKNFYFMEVNTRIQVEHTVTEELTGIDLVKTQIAIAQGEKLPFKQKEIQFKGHVIQCRINAEDPSEGFRPSPGHLEYYLPPGGPKVRVDSACYSGYSIPPYYDSMIAKLICHGKTREEAVKISQRALKEFHIGGVKSTIPFHLKMLSEEDFKADNYHIKTIDNLLDKGVKIC